MKKRRYFLKALAVFLVTALTLSVSAGCDSEDKKTVSNTDKLKEIIETEAPQITLTFVFPDNLRPSEDAIGKVLAEAEARMKNTLNYRLNFRFEGSYFTQSKLTTVLKSSAPCDALFASRWMMWNAIQEDLLMDVSEIFPQYAPNFYSNFDESEIEQCKIDGKLYMIPHYMKSSERLCVIARSDLMDKYGIKDIKTVEDYELYMKTIKENEKNIAPGLISIPINELFMLAGNYANFYTLVTKWDDKTYRLKPWEETEEFKTAMVTMKRWKDNGYLINDNDMQTALLTNTAASCVIYMDQVQQFARYLHSTGKFKVFALYPENTAAIVGVNTAGFVINKNSKNAEHVLKFIEWVQSSQENHDLFMYGIEGEHYTLEGGNVVLPKGQIPFFGWYGSEVFQNINYLRTFNTDPANFKELLIRNTDNQYSIFNDFQPRESTIEKLNQAINERYQDFWELEQKLSAGVMPDIDEFIKEQRKLGIDKVINEFQKDIDAWLAQKNNS